MLVSEGPVRSGTDNRGILCVLERTACSQDGLRHTIRRLACTTRIVHEVGNITFIFLRLHSAHPVLDLPTVGIRDYTSVVSLPRRSNLIAKRVLIDSARGSYCSRTGYISVTAGHILLQCHYLISGRCPPAAELLQSTSVA
jgi:hypothetical protein